MNLAIPEEFEEEKFNFKHMEKFDDASIEFFRRLPISRDKLDELVQKVVNEQMEAQKKGIDLKKQQLEKIKEKERKQKNRKGDTIYIFCNKCHVRFEDCKCE